MQPDPRLAVDGVLPAAVARPTSVDELRDVLAEAAERGHGVAPVGGGGALGLGNPLERYDLALDTTGLDRILEHQAADLVLSVEAGATFASVADALDRHGQWLPLDVPHPGRATIGGLIATALSGPSRAGHGTLRDYLIGIVVAYPTGSVAKAGGMVVKNVSGFDLMRLHHGALGTLGVIVSANFKVLPRPRGQATVLLRCGDLASALAAASRLSSARPSALVVESSGAEPVTVAARWDGRQSQADASVRGAASSGDATVMPADESRAWWTHYVDSLNIGAGSGDVATDQSELGARSPDVGEGVPALPAPPTPSPALEIRLGTHPSTVASLAETLAVSLVDHHITVERLTVWPDLGSVLVRTPASPDAPRVIVDAATATGATWRVMSAPPDLKAGLDVWGPAPPSLEVMRRLKAEFDPARTLNPGRFCGHL